MANCPGEAIKQNCYQFVPSLQRRSILVGIKYECCKVMPSSWEMKVTEGWGESKNVVVERMIILHTLPTINLLCQAHSALKMTDSHWAQNIFLLSRRLLSQQCLLLE